MYTIKQAQDSNNTFYQVFLKGVIVKQSEDFQECFDYVESKDTNQFETFELPKSVMKAAAKNNKAVCLDWNVSVFGKAETVQMDYQATMVIHNDAEADHEGDAIYKVYKTDTGFKAILWSVWTKELKDNFPQAFEGEKGLKALIKKLV